MLLRTLKKKRSPQRPSIVIPKSSAALPSALLVPALQSKPCGPSKKPWIPAHPGTIEGSSLSPNEEAHSVAWGLTYSTPGNTYTTGRPDLLSSYNEICKHHHPSGRLPPLSGSSLCRAQAVPLRILLTITCPRPAPLHTVYPERFPSPDSPLYGGYADFEHVLLGCASAWPPFAQEEIKTLIEA
ncbi:hypothetical protein HPB52_011890 [Rhipicephalus sanguineus]|uniref:Uncharacterized protein n=1 Tax=Rhipicephalus sanguineus TaxID=34632 RepID=A0A9D4Q259_RHISA|nr:hypothetical protein HPB52_011890 [Rhipicephalus sanguineus]